MEDSTRISNEESHKGQSVMQELAREMNNELPEDISEDLSDENVSKEKSEKSNKKHSSKTFGDKLKKFFRNPLIILAIYFLISMPVFSDKIAEYIPMFGTSKDELTTMNLLIRGLTIGLIFEIINFFRKSMSKDR